MRLELRFMYVLDVENYKRKKGRNLYLYCDKEMFICILTKKGEKTLIPHGMNFFHYNRFFLEAIRQIC